MDWVKLRPLASIDLTACSVTRLTSLTNCSLRPVRAASSPLDFSSTMCVSSAARWPSAVDISSVLPTTLRATSALTASSVRSTSLAFCLSTLLTPVDMPVMVRSASCTLERIAVVVVAASCASERSASVLLVFTASLSCWMRPVMALEADAARLPIERSASALLVFTASLSCWMRAVMALRRTPPGCRSSARPRRCWS